MSVCVCVCVCVFRRAFKGSHRDVVVFYESSRGSFYIIWVRFL